MVSSMAILSCTRTFTVQDHQERTNRFNYLSTGEYFYWFTMEEILICRKFRRWPENGGSCLGALSTWRYWAYSDEFSLLPVGWLNLSTPRYWPSPVACVSKRMRSAASSYLALLLGFGHNVVVHRNNLVWLSLRLLFSSLLFFWFFLSRFLASNYPCVCLRDVLFINWTETSIAFMFSSSFRFLWFGPFLSSNERSLGWPYHALKRYEFKFVKILKTLN